MFDFLKYNVIGLKTPGEKNYIGTIEEAKENREAIVNSVFERKVLSEFVTKNCPINEILKPDLDTIKTRISAYLDAGWDREKEFKKILEANITSKQSIYDEYDKKMYIQWAKENSPDLARILIFQEKENKLLKEN
ncbi:hypothetical protein [Mesoplasma seiffertii]|uniref:hypothetical protein n=1 Tax=Mesoplasma seiffertii TaxID=28224 RepID=UPI00047871EC|nr:hypothetical protein [Mesoplasma seiffertii]